MTKITSPKPLKNRPDRRAAPETRAEVDIQNYKKMLTYNLYSEAGKNNLDIKDEIKKFMLKVGNFLSQLQETAIRDGLIGLGWTPPGSEIFDGFMTETELKRLETQDYYKIMVARRRDFFPPEQMVRKIKIIIERYDHG